MGDDEDKTAGKKRDSWFDGHVLTPQEIADQRAKQIELDARSQHRAAQQTLQGQERDSMQHDGKIEASVVAHPRASYVQRMDQYWQKEFTQEQSEKPRLCKSQYAKKEAKENEVEAPPHVSMNSREDSKPQSLTTKELVDDRSALDNQDGSNGGATNEASNKTESDKIVNVLEVSSHPPPATPPSNPLVVARAPVALYLGQSPDSMDHKTRSIPPTAQLVAASSGEVVRNESIQSKPGAYAHIGPDGRLSTTSTLSSRSATNRYSMTADDLSNNEEFREELLRDKSSKEIIAGSKELSSELQKIQEEGNASYDQSDSGGIAVKMINRNAPDGGMGAATTTLTVANTRQAPSSRFLNHLYSNRPTTRISKTSGQPHQDDTLVNAEMVDDAETVFYAQNVERADLLYKNPLFLGAIGCVSLAALIALILVLIAPVEERAGDERCWVPPETLNIPMQCYCFGTPEARVKQLLNEENATGLTIYNMSQLLLKEVGVLDPLVTNSTLLAEWDQGNLTSCDPINQCLLSITAFGTDLSRDEVLGAPIDVFVDIFVFCEIYVTMGGINWTRSDSWLEPNNLCDWYGLDCIFLSVFSQLAFPRNNLQGTIPGSMMQHLKRIRHLDFSGNPGIVGTMPSELGEMKSLNEIDFSDCSLSGTIPAELGSLELLDSLSLGRNNLSGTIPSKLFAGHMTTPPWNASDGNMTYLRFIDFQNNHLTGTIPSIISRAERLTFLRLQKNQLTGSIPEEISKLTFLELLNVGQNAFTGTMPTALGCASRLRMLNFYESGLKPHDLLDVDDVEFSLLNETSSNYNPVLESLCPSNRRSICNGTDLPGSRMIILDCSKTPHDCSCCATAHEEAMRNEFQRAAIQITCAERVPALAVGMEF